MIENIINKALRRIALTAEEALTLYTELETSELIAIADKIRQEIHPNNRVGWIIDRNVNITNVCISNCSFCNFHCKVGATQEYTTTLEEYIEKIEEMILLGGDQLLIQGGMHPKYGLDFYTSLFSSIRKLYPLVKLHALGPPEIVHIARKSRKSYKEVLKILRESGLTSLPGAGAEILCDRVRSKLSPGKANSREWLDVMREAHVLNMTTSATMMFGHIETLKERVDHLIKVRDLQEERPKTSQGFAAFIAWPVISNGTQLALDHKITPTTAVDYIRLTAISRIVLNNIDNIQASWLTVGKETAQLALHSGANDMGSIMIEENVVSSAGINYKMDKEGIERAIAEAGFTPYQRDQAYYPQ